MQWQPGDAAHGHVAQRITDCTPPAPRAQARARRWAVGLHHLALTPYSDVSPRRSGPARCHLSRRALCGSLTPLSL